MNMKGDGAKMFAMVLFVFCFFISGYEHSIANMCTFAIALVLDHPGTVSWYGVFHNLVPVTIGNLIGGGVLMGVMYYYVNKPFWMTLSINRKTENNNPPKLRSFTGVEFFCAESYFLTLGLFDF